jgi:hypothetical protein
MVQNLNLGESGIHTDGIVISYDVLYSFDEENTKNTYICFVWVRIKNM